LLQKLWGDEQHQPPATECHVTPIGDRKVEHSETGGRQIVGERLAARGVAAAGERQRQFMHAGIVPDQHQPLRIGGGLLADGLQQLRGIGAIEFPQNFDLRRPDPVLHGLPGDLPGLVRPDRVRNQHGVRKRRMPADKAADLGGVVAAAVVEPSVHIAAAGRVGLGLGVTQQHQTAHGAISLRFKSCRINVQAGAQDKVTSAGSVV
jgi:hypothetical protein